MASRAGALLKARMILIGKVSAMPSRRAFIFSTAAYVVFPNSRSLIKLFLFKSLCLSASMYFSYLIHSLGRKWRDEWMDVFLCVSLPRVWAAMSVIIPLVRFSMLCLYITLIRILPNAATGTNLKSSPTLNCHLPVGFN